MDLKLLIVEDDRQQAALLSQQLSAFGHCSEIVYDGQAAIEKISRDTFDALVLDRMLPVLGGMSVIESLRAAGIGIPTLMLTALGQTLEKVEGLNAGADDYVAKPIDPEELNARLLALVRARRWQSGTSDTLEVGDLRISPVKFRVWRNGRNLDLPKTEFNLLLELARNAGSVLTRSMLLERVWQYEFEPETNIVDVYIRRLRLKLCQFGDPDPVVTVRGVGYALRFD